MKHLLKVFSVLMFAFFLNSSSPALAANISTLVEQFKQATDLQRAKILETNFASEISASGIVSNVEEYNYFKETNDTLHKYYRVTTELQKTPQNTPYEVVFLYKDADKVNGVLKSQKIEATGNIIKVVDDRLQIAAWIMVGGLTEQEKELFRQDLTP